MRTFEDPLDIMDSAIKQLSRARIRLYEVAFDSKIEKDNMYSICHTLDFTEGEILELYEFLTFLSDNTDEVIIHYLFKENDGQKL